jgi:flagellar L-ring protein precursor FlgH
MKHARTAARFGAALSAAVALAAVAEPSKDGESMLDPQTYRPLVSEDKAYRVGDVLTVVVRETASASTGADSRADRKATVSAEVGSNKVGTHSASAGASTDNEGGGRTQRSGKLTAQLSARVIEVLANGDLSIHGQQRITVNGEEQTIRLSGIVRTRDIGENNTILSGRIAGADIEFDGEGFIADKSRPGWFSRLLSAMGF